MYPILCKLSDITSGYMIIILANSLCILAHTIFNSRKIVWYIKLSFSYAHLQEHIVYNQSLMSFCFLQYVWVLIISMQEDQKKRQAIDNDPNSIQCPPFLSLSVNHSFVSKEKQWLLLGFSFLVPKKEKKRERIYCIELSNSVKLLCFSFLVKGYQKIYILYFCLFVPKIPCHNDLTSYNQLDVLEWKAPTTLAFNHVKAYTYITHGNIYFLPCSHDIALIIFPGNEWVSLNSFLRYRY